MIVTGNYDCSDKFGKYNVPGSACTVEFLRFANKHGFVNVGKPESFMIERIIQRDGLDKHECIMFLVKAHMSLLCFCAKATMSLLGFCARQASLSLLRLWTRHSLVYNVCFLI